MCHLWFFTAPSTIRIHSRSFFLFHIQTVVHFFHQIDKLQWNAMKWKQGKRSFPCHWPLRWIYRDIKLLVQLTENSNMSLNLLPRNQNFSCVIICKATKWRWPFLSVTMSGITYRLLLDELWKLCIDQNIWEPDRLEPSFLWSPDDEGSLRSQLKSIYWTFSTY